MVPNDRTCRHATSRDDVMPALPMPISFTSLAVKGVPATLYAMVRWPSCICMAVMPPRLFRRYALIAVREVERFQMHIPMPVLINS